MILQRLGMWCAEIIYLLGKVRSNNYMNLVNEIKRNLKYKLVKKNAAP